jgi:hypothetical protein
VVAVDIEQSQLSPHRFQVLPQGRIANQSRFQPDSFVRLQRIEKITNEIISHRVARQLKVTLGD